VSGPSGANSVGERLRELRRRLGLSQEQLARRLGVSFATVNRWESGRTQISARSLTALAELEASAAAADNDGHDDADSDSALPTARSSFVGRARELAELTALLRQSRLVTLIGPGGAGKSRLAAEALSRRADADADVVFVALEQIRHPRTLASALASRLQVHDQQGTPLIESLQSALTAGPPRLLLLDGAERLVGQVAELAGQLLDAVPELRIVVTSRTLLGVPGEVCWTVPPLGCPAPAAEAADIAGSDAVLLFIARASERLPDFQAADVAPHSIAELCRRLDGLPLAIELIAGWVGTLSVREMLQQRAVLLDSEPAHHGGRRLADVMQASYDLLTAEQRGRLAMLSVFAGPFRIADVQAILDVDLATAVATARALVDSSWLVVTRGGEQNVFSLLETIATFTALQLARGGDGPAVRRRHALHFAAVAAESEQALAGPDAADWAARMEAAVADLDLAMHWAGEHGDVDLGLNVSSALWRWWLFSGQLGVGRDWLAKFLITVGDRDDELTGRAYCAAAVLAAENGDYSEAVRQAELAMAIFGPLGLKTRMTLAATVIGSANRYLGNHEGARRGFVRAMELRDELGDRRGMSVSINNLALLELDGGDLHRARQLFEQALAIKREFGERRSIAIGLANLADVLIKTSQWDAAEAVLAEGAGLAAGNPQLVGTIACNQGALAAHRQDWATATERFEAAIASSQAGGHPHDVVEAMIGLGRVRALTGDHRAAVARLRAAHALATEIGNPQRLAEAEAALAEAALAEVAGPDPAGPAAAGEGPSRPENLTGRQAEVLALLATGLSNKQIAAELYLSTATVERHLATIYRNLGLGGRVEAARFAMENGLTGQPRNRTVL
jgi:predicted ATPase/DNA-binding CsgD family transcriptional regulator/DNA-binding XRE family transcriptional regulator